MLIGGKGTQNFVKESDLAAQGIYPEAGADYEVPMAIYGELTKGIDEEIGTMMIEDIRNVLSRYITNARAELIKMGRAMKRDKCLAQAGASGT